MEENIFFFDKIVSSYHSWVVMGIIFCAMISYATEKISLELTSLFSIASLMMFFHFFPLFDEQGLLIFDLEQIIIGFANPALIAIIALLVIGQAIIKSNALNVIPKIIMTMSCNNAVVAIIFSLIIVVIISAFINNTPVVIIFIPIFAHIAKDLNISPSKVMMPLSFAAIAGGMITLIGSSTNLLIAGVTESLKLPPIGFFDFFVPGSIMAIVALLYIFLILPKLLPKRKNSDDNLEDDRIFVSQIVITQKSGFMGKKMIEGSLEELEHLTIRVITRKNEVFLPPFQDEMMVELEDTLTISGTKDNLHQLINKSPQLFVKNLHIEEDDSLLSEEKQKIDDESHFAEFVISPSSTMIGQTIKRVGFYRNYNCPIVGIQRRGSLIKNKMSAIRLLAGDLLLIMGKTEQLQNLRNNKDIIFTRWSLQSIGSIANIIKTLLIFTGAVTLSALNIVPITITAFTAAILLIFFKSINLKQASHAIDRNIFLIIVASIAMGNALQVTGGASFLADSFIAATAKLSNIGIISCFFLFVALMTNFLSNSATAVLFTPIAVNLALSLGIDPNILIYATIFACNCSFITPIGYQTNLLVMSPGRYKFRDFVFAGFPLAALMCTTYVGLLIFYFKI